MQWQITRVQADILERTRIADRAVNWMKHLKRYCLPPNTSKQYDCIKRTIYVEVIVSTYNFASSVCLWSVFRVQSLAQLLIKIRLLWNLRYITFSFATPSKKLQENDDLRGLWVQCPLDFLWYRKVEVEELWH